ncbi:unnamed protein product [Urochloa humidicola]
MPAPAATSSVLDQTSSPAATPATASTKKRPHPTSSLSPAARPFLPARSGSPARGGSLQVSEDDLECVDYEFTPSPSPTPRSYRDALLRSSPVPGALAGSSPPAATVEIPTAPTASLPVATTAATGVAATAGGRRKRRRTSKRVRRKRPPPPLVAAPPRAGDGRLSRNLAARLGPIPPRVAKTCLQPRVDSDGFQEYVSRSTRRKLGRAAVRAPPLPRAPSSPPARRIPPELAGRCLNCLSYTHRVATCKLPQRCLRCHEFRHLARNCTRPRSPPSTLAAGGHLPPVAQAAGRLSRHAPRRIAPTSLVPSRTPSPPLLPSRSSGSSPNSTSTGSRRRSQQPNPECCYAEFSDPMTADEARLHISLIALVGNASGFSVEEAKRAIVAAAGLGSEEVTVKPFHPGSFLISCRNQAARDQVLNASPIPLATRLMGLSGRGAGAAAGGGGNQTRGGGPTVRGVSHDLTKATELPVRANALEKNFAKADSNKQVATAELDVGASSKTKDGPTQRSVKWSTAVCSGQLSSLGSDAAAFEFGCIRDISSPRDHDPMLLEAGLVAPQIPSFCAVGVDEEVLVGSPSMMHPVTGSDAEASAEAEPVELSTTVPSHLLQASEYTKSTPPITDVLEPPRFELGSPNDGPEFPPGFESGYKVSGPLDVGLHDVVDSTLFTKSASTERAAMVVASEVDHSVALEAFTNLVTKGIPKPLLDKPLRRRRVDPVLIDAPPQMPSSEASGIRRSYRQALDPLSAVKTAKRGEVLLMRRLGEVGVPMPLAASADQAVKQFFQEEHPPHHWDALSDMFPVMKNKSKTFPFVGSSVD